MSALPVGPNLDRLPRQTNDTLLLISLALLLAGPRVEIAAVGGSSIRLEDLILAVLLWKVVQRWKDARDLGYPASGMRVLVAVSILAVFISVLSGSIMPLSGMLYGLRQLEYWAVFPVVLYVLMTAGREFEQRLWRLLKFITVLQVSTAVLQFSGLLTVSFSKFSLERGAGLTSGPYELGAMCAALACVWFARGNHGFALVAVVGLFVSSSRVSILALGVGLLVLVVRQAVGVRRSSAADRARTSSSFVVVTFGLAFSALLYPLAAPILIEPLQARVQSTSISETWAYAGQYAGFLTPPTTSDEYVAIAYSGISRGVDFEMLGANGDTSNLVRFFRWQVLLGATNTPSEVIFGHGPSFAGPSVDGGLLRIFIELGVAGCLAWLLLLRRITAGTRHWFVATVVIFVVGSVFIDVFFAMRPMILFWLLAALSRFEVTGAKTQNSVAVN